MTPEMDAGLLAAIASSRRALAAGLILSLAMAPVGAFLTLRRMSLTGDAIAHGILPGVAAGYLFAGASTLAMAAGGLAAGLIVALAAAFVSRETVQREDASLAAFYLIALAAGLAVLSARASPEEVQHVLFGAVSAIDRPALWLIAAAASGTLMGLAIIWPALIIDTLDREALHGRFAAGAIAHLAFVSLTVLMLVAALQAVGAMLAVGLMILPAAAARFWSAGLFGLIGGAAAIGAASTIVGFVASAWLLLPPGPCIILAAGAIYVASIIFRRRTALRRFGAAAA